MTEEVEGAPTWITNDKLQSYVSYRAASMPEGPTLKKRRTEGSRTTTSFNYTTSEEFPKLDAPSGSKRYGRLSRNNNKKNTLVAVPPSGPSKNRTSPGSNKSANSDDAKQGVTYARAVTSGTSTSNSGNTNTAESPRVPTSPLTPETGMPESFRVMFAQLQAQHARIAELEKSMTEWGKSVALLQKTVTDILAAVDKPVNASTNQQHRSINTINANAALSLIAENPALGAAGSNNIKHPVDTGHVSHPAQDHQTRSTTPTVGKDAGQGSLPKPVLMTEEEKYAWSEFDKADEFAATEEFIDRYKGNEKGTEDRA